VSTLTKVFVLLVSVLAIFLSGVVVTFVVNTENYRAAYQGQERLAKAAQVTAVVAEGAMKRGISHRNNMIDKLKDNLRTLESQNAEFLRKWETEAQARSLAENESFTAVALSKSLRDTIHNMYTAQNAIQTNLNEAHQAMLTSEAQTVHLTRELNTERVRADTLESIGRQRLEKIYELEDENTSIRSRLQEVALKPSDWVETGDQVSQVPVRESGVAIRGQVMAVDSDLASISVGSADGVRKNMKFLVYRDNQYLGDLLVTHVESSQSAGRMNAARGAVIRGDSVTTGFN
jgi:hypothetical protein